MYVVPGASCRALSEAVAKSLGAKVARVELKTFPDGEVYARILDDLTGEDVVVVQTTLGNDRLLELLLLLEAASGRDARRIVAAVPYYAYSRQDERFQTGEALSAAVVAKSLGLWADGLVTVDPHKDHILDFFPGDAVGTSAIPELAAHFAAQGVDLVLAPDAGARGRAAEAARLMDVGFDHLEKTRLSGEEVVMRPKELPVEGKTIAIVDDIISTGGTMAKATGQLFDQGAKAVYCAATHGLFIGGAVEKLTNAGVAGIVATDTIPSSHAVVSAAPAVVRGVQEVFAKKTKKAVA